MRVMHVKGAEVWLFFITASEGHEPQACLQINGSLARAAIRELLEEGLIKPIAHHSAQGIYTRAGATQTDAKEE